ncbi:MAG TPA: rhomboid family intramembrane serine protease [Chitinophagaceae bacterium]|nr:rhomboid family intramembrane serine protease [Chitinophagaceae bacterium]
MSVREYKPGRSPLLGQSNNSLVMLIAVNAIIFVALNFLKIVYFLSYDDNITAASFFQKQILDWFTLPVATEKLITRPWTIFTYMFSHLSIWALLSTLLWLWGFGFILQDLTGNKKIFPIYIYGGFAGAVCFLLSVNLIPALHQSINLSPSLIGGGAAVMAVAVATTSLATDYRIFPMINGGIPLWVLTLIFVAIDYATIASSSGGYAIAHLAGGIIGFVFIRQLRRGNDWSDWMNNFVDWFNNLFNPGKKSINKPVKEKKINKVLQKTSDLTQQRVDELLDKINAKGYNMLTDEEKNFLKEASKEEL